MTIPQKVSLIIPVYNGEKTLSDCLNSVLNQTYNNYEVIVVDNNSTDKTKEIIANYQSNNSNIRYVFEPERKRGAARNSGERKALGDIILMTDSDCIVPSDWITRMIEPVIKNECDSVQGSQTDITDNYWSRQEQIRYLEREKNTHTVINRVDSKNFAIKKDFLEKVGFSSRAYYTGNDTELSIRLQKNNCRIKFLNEVKVRHHHANSLSGVIKQQYTRAYCCRMMAQEHQDYLKSTNFLQMTAQTWETFFSFFPGLIGALIKQGCKWTYFEFVAGMAWRAGLIVRILTFF